jgi:hypothetical protein
MNGVLTTLIAAIVGSAAGYVSALLTSLLQRRAVIDESIRAIRSDLYAAVWRKMALFPLWPRAEDVTYGAVLELSRSLRSWFFGASPEGPSQPAPAKLGGAPGNELPHPPGGMYLSRPARSAFLALQEHLNEVVEPKDDRDELDHKLGRADYDSIQRKCSELRTEITRDLLSRRRAFLVR